MGTLALAGLWGLLRTGLVPGLQYWNQQRLRDYGPTHQCPGLALHIPIFLPFLWCWIRTQGSTQLGKHLSEL